MAEPAQLQGLLHQAAQMMEIDRLEQVFEGAALHGLNGRVRRRERRDQDHRQAWVQGVDLVEDLQPRLVRQAHVQDDRVGLDLAHQLQPAPARLGHEDLEGL